MKYSDKQLEIKTTVEQDKPFPGKNIDQMPLLLGEGRSPWTAVRFMQERINHAQQFPDLKSHLDVSDLIAYDSSKRSTDVKFILTVDKNRRVTEQGRKALELIHPHTTLTSDYAANVDDVYDSLSGIVVPRTGLGILERDLTEEEFLLSKPWRIVLRHPDEVPKEFAEDPNLMKESYRWVKSHTNRDKTMGVYMDNNSETAKLRAFCVNRLDDRSRLYGRLYLDDDLGRLVGYLAPEAPHALDNAEQKVINSERRIITVSEVLEETSQTSAYASDQIKKLQNILDQRGYVISPK